MCSIFSPPHFMMMHGKNMCTVCFLACLLVIIGALNWGLVGLGWLVGGGANWNIVNLILGKWTTLEALVYVLVGIAGLFKLFMYSKCCGKCCSQCAKGGH